MAFWSEVKHYEPLRQNRWYINFSQNGLSQNVFALKTCKKPEYEITVTEHTILNDVRRFPGILKWKPIDVSMVSVRGDTESFDLANVLQNLVISNAGYQVAGAEDINVKKGDSPEIVRTTGIAKSNFAPTLGSNIEILQVDANGAVIEKWTLYSPFISNVNYGTLTYENDGFVDISFTIQYDYAKLETLASPATLKKREAEAKAEQKKAGK